MGTSQIEPPHHPQEKTTLKKPRPIRVKEAFAFYIELLFSLHCRNCET